jgi:F0F1-type ATP synthase membrane subunit b/b'
MLTEFTTSYFSQAFWLIVTFSILYLFIKYKIVKDMEVLFQNRDDSIDTILSQAKHNNEVATALHKEAAILEEQARHNAIKDKDSIIAAYAQDNNSQIKALHAHNAQEMQKYMTDIKKEKDKLYEDIPEIVKNITQQLKAKVVDDIKLDKLN